MSKRNYPHENRERETNKNSIGCVRQTPQRKRKEKISKHGMCKRNSPDKNKASMGCVRETPQIKIKPAWEV